MYVRLKRKSKNMNFNTELNTFQTDKFPQATQFINYLIEINN